jgi:ABC-type transport system involved in cytochrome bd biosynthesis fused ATPase/permease subunit
MDDEVLVFVAFFGAVAFVVSTLVNARMRRLQLKAVSEFNVRLLDRIGSIKDFNDFMQTDGGAKFMNSLTAASTVRQATAPSHRIMLASQIGIVLSAVGIGFLLLQATLAGQGAFGFTVIGAISLSIGLGFIISAGASYWLARRLGVLGEGREITS